MKVLPRHPVAICAADFWSLDVYSLQEKKRLEMTEFLKLWFYGVSSFRLPLLSVLPLN